MKIEDNELLLWTYKTIINYLEKLNDPKHKVTMTGETSLNDLNARINLSLPKDVANCNEAYKNFSESMESFLDNSVLSGHRHFFNQLYGELQVPALAAEFIATLNNSSMATYEMSPVATLIEKKIIEKFSSMIWPSGKSTEVPDGLLVLGGSYANMETFHKWP